jgi:hypothetical protein
VAEGQLRESLAVAVEVRTLQTDDAPYALARQRFDGGVELLKWVCR